MKVDCCLEVNDFVEKLALSKKEYVFNKSPYPSNSVLKNYLCIFSLLI